MTRATIAAPYKTLVNGAKMPMIGLGTWQSKPNETRLAVEHAISVGYRHIDTAFAYRNEKEVGEAIRNKIADGTVKREELFVTTKLWNTYLNEKDVARACQMSLDSLNIGYIDLYLQHNSCGMKPNPDGKMTPPVDENGFVDESYYDPVPLETTWKAMEKLVDGSGKVRAIGVSNFSLEQMQRIFHCATIKPAANQVECNLYLQHNELYQLCETEGCVLTAYAPIGSPGQPAHFSATSNTCLKDPYVGQLADKYGKTPAQILIRFLIEVGRVPIPKSIRPSRIEENIAIFDFSFEPYEIDQLKTLDRYHMDFQNHGWKGLQTHPEYPWNNFLKEHPQD